MKFLQNLLKRYAPLGLLILLISGCKEPQPEKTEQVSRPVKLYTVSSSHDELTYRYPGSVSSIKETILAFEVPGKITKLEVKEGEFVNRGQVLAEIDSRDYEAQLDSANSDLGVAESDYQRYEKAYKSNAVTSQALQQAKRNMDVARSAYNQAKKALMETKIMAPFSGRIVSKEIEPFATVHAKQPIMHLHSESAFEMIVNVPESDWAQGNRVNSADEIKLENQLLVTLSAMPNQNFVGSITEFSGRADRVTRTYTVRVAFDVPDNVPVSSGMTGHVVYTLPKQSSTEISIPLDAIVGASDNSAFVWLYDSSAGTVNKRVVELGKITNDKAFVTSGLSKGDQIAMSGVHHLYDGYPVHSIKD